MYDDDYTASRIQLALAPRPVRFYPTLASTNDAAREWLIAGDAPSGAVVVADEQTHGRGRFGRIWHTPPGVALALSVILKPHPDHLPQMNMIGTLAVTDTLNVLQIPEVTVKWANDVLIAGKKVSGILPEVIWEGDTFKGVILGIGVNVRNDLAADALHHATTVERALQRAVDRVSLLAVLLYRLETWCDQIAAAAVPATYRDRMTLLGQSVTVTHIHTHTALHGTAVDVDGDGALVLRLADGTTTRVHAGDVTLNPPTHRQ